MSDNKKVIKAGIGYTVGNYLLKGLSFITIPIFTRIMSTSDYGLYNTYLSYEALLFVIVGFSFHASLKNAKYKYNERFGSYVSAIVLIQLISLLCWIIVVNLFYPFLNDYTDYPRVLIDLLLIYCFATSVIQVYNAYLGLKYEYSSFLKISGFNAILNIGISIFLIMSHVVEAYIGRIIGTVVPAVLISVYIITKLWKKAAPQINKEFSSFAFSYSLPIIPHGLSQVVLSQFDRIMIKSLVGNAQAGIYSFAYNIYSIIFLTTSSTDQVWGPWFYEKMNEGDEKDISEKAHYYTWLIAVIVSFVILAAPEIVVILGSTAYKEASYTVVPIVASGFFAFLYTLPVQIEYYYSKTKLIALATSCAAVVNIILNYFCINRFGYVAAAYTTLVTYVLYFIFHLVISYKIMKHMVFSLKSIIGSSLFVLLVSSTALLFLSNAGVRWILIVALAIGAIIYINRKFGIRKILYILKKKYRGN